MTEAVDHDRCILSFASLANRFDVLLGVEVGQLAHIEIKAIGVLASAAVFGVNQSNAAAQVLSNVEGTVRFAATAGYRASLSRAWCLVAFLNMVGYSYGRGCRVQGARCKVQG